MELQRVEEKVNFSYWPEDLILKLCLHVQINTAKLIRSSICERCRTYISTLVILVYTSCLCTSSCMVLVQTERERESANMSMVMSVLCTMSVLYYCV